MEKKTNFNYYFKGKVRAYFSRFQEKSSILLKVIWPNACFLAKSRECISKFVQSQGILDRSDGMNEHAGSGTTCNLTNMPTTIVRKPASFRLRADLLEHLKRNAVRENRTLNNYVESEKKYSICTNSIKQTKKP